MADLFAPLIGLKKQSKAKLQTQSDSDEIYFDEQV